MKLPLNAKNFADVVEKYANNPKGFFIDILRFDRLDEWQECLLDETLGNNQGGKKVAIASAHSTGKTLVASGIAIHRLVCYAGSHTLITSATFSQLKSAFANTISNVVESSIITDWFDVLAESVTVKGLEDNWIKLQPWSVNRRESFAGIHCKSPCLIADEASAIDPVIFESWDGNMMHENSLLLMLGNPLFRRGNLFDAFNGKKDFFTHRHISAYDSSFISRKWIEEMKATYGEDSDQFRVRVLGQFPNSDSDTFIPESLLKSAVNRNVFIDPLEPIIAGIDVGQFRDASVMVLRQGLKVILIHRWKSRDTMFVAQELYQLLVQYNVHSACIDGNGVGSGVADRLAILLPDKIHRFKFANLPDTERQYFNTRSRAWGRAKKWLAVGSIPDDKDFISDGSSLLYNYDKIGRYQLESKELAQKRGIGSPDSFDAFSYSLEIDVEKVIKKDRFEDVVEFNLF